MKKMYLIIGVIILIAMIVVFSLIKNNNTTSTTASKIYKSSELFTNRDLEQNINTTNATKYTVSDGENINITSEGTYVISGTAKNATIYVEAQDADKVQIVLENLSITNETMPCIYIKTADKVFVTSKGDNKLNVTGAFSIEDSNNLNAVIFSKQDVTFNGTGTLNIESSQNGITGKDDVKITGGTYNIKSQAVAIRANDSIRIADGNITLNAGTDGLHAENSSDDTKGYVFINGGEINIEAVDDCIHGTSVVQIDNGNINLNGAEGIEGTYVQINGGTLKINATGDGINAGSKSDSYKVTIEITGGDINIKMADGDTDGVDSNGDIKITGGTTSVTGNSTFDYDGTATFTGGTIIVNGTKVDEIPNSATGVNAEN
ncbi:MAG: carbohydrate-binding domain-containing protein [Clostridia bacterium]|nr:carbohydrate-binding domain-containing protein [Clostridia bacterium]